MVRKEIFVFVSVLLIIFLIYFFGVQIIQQKYNEFPAAGHILVQNSNGKTTRYYFDEGTKYKDEVNDKVSFKDTSEKKVNISNKSFVHYSNGSISTLKVAALLNLKELNSSLPKYYTIFPGTIINKQSNDYFINFNNDKLILNSFVVKISSNKYLIVAPEIKVTMGDTKKEIKDNYIELTFQDGNIIRIENQEMSMQNISSNSMIEIGNIKIDLNTRNIVSGKQTINLNSITIESDDNIEIPKDDENSIIDNEKANNSDMETNDSNNQTNHPNNPFDGLDNGIIDTSDNEIEEIVEENAKIKDPEFTVGNLIVGPYNMQTNIMIEDENGLLTGDISIKIIETDTNKIVYESKEISGVTELNIENENLAPDTSYILIVNSDYEKNGITYNKDFVQKTFVTESIGISLEKDYTTTDALSLNIQKDSYSEVEQVTVNLIKGEKVINTYDVQLKSGENNIVTFNELDNNTEYTVQVNNFIYSNSIVGDSLTIEKKFKTLKNKPTYGSPKVVINKKTSQFEISLDNVNDPDNGIVSYRYELYDARTINTDSPQLIKEVERDNQSPVTIDVDGNVQRGIPYALKVIITFNDNEKEYEFETNYSDVIKMDGLEFPTVRFESKNVTFERIEGTIIIDDANGTVNVNDGQIITITYQDSVGNSETMTTSGSLKIPFSVNNLRANETYNISVYATVDLQDGNPVIDNCYIGSVLVKTKDPNPFKMNYQVTNDDINKAFKIEAQLTSDDKPTDLEASTLSGIEFKLYSGTDTSGKLVRSVKQVDRDESYYQSDLQTEFYDNQFEISPSFFGIKNQDLTDDYYTIEVTGAYDYTKYQNNLPITNNTITFRVNGTVPDLPENPENAIELAPIRNNDSGDKYREDLNADTIVGYQVKAIYDNSDRYAKNIIYNIYNAETNELVETQKYVVPANGNIEPINFYLKDGTPYSKKDTDFRRGNSYYFTYQIELDINDDGEIDTIYPIGDVVLKSEVVSPMKQEPTLKIYPSQSSTTTITFKYNYQDIDNVIDRRMLSLQINSQNIGQATLEQCKVNEYKIFKAEGLSQGTFQVMADKSLLKSDGITSELQLTLPFEGEYIPLLGEYSLSQDTNRLIITFLDYNNNQDFYNRITGVDVTFKQGNDKIVKEGLQISNGTITVDLTDLKKFLGKKIETEVSANYDSGLIGFDIESPVVIQNIPAIGEEKYYYTLDSNNNFMINTNAYQSSFDFINDIGNHKITITNTFNKRKKEMNINIDNQGISYNYEYLNFKKIKKVNISSDGENTFVFNDIIPGISILDSDGNPNIATTLNELKTKINLTGFDSNQIKDNKIYIDIYKTNESGTTSDFIKTEEFTVDDLNKTIAIDGLQAKTNYYFKVLAEVRKGDGYEKVQLYDIDDKNNTKNYYFQTLGVVGFQNLNVTYQADSYNERKLKVTYNLNQTTGFERLEYRLYKLNNDGSETEVNLNISPDYAFKQNMTKLISIPQDCGVEADNLYRLVITPYTTISFNGEDTEIKLDDEGIYDYNFSKLYTPYIGITSISYQDYSLEFKVNVLDSQKAIVDGEYQIKIYNNQGEDVTPNEYQNKIYDINAINQKFTMKNTEQGRAYRFQVITKIDQYNNTSKITTYTKTYQTTITNDEGINVGDIYAVSNTLNRTKIDLQFYNSYKLTDIDKIRYSLYDSNGYSSDNVIDFLPTLNNDGNASFYSVTLPENITDYGIYYLQVQFLKQNKIIYESTIEYRYTK